MATHRMYTKEKRMLVMQGRRGRNRASRPKTFKTEELANAYAKVNGIKEYSLENLSANKIRLLIEV